MSDCPNCKRAVTTPGDFCEHCGQYLRWAASGEVPTATRRRPAPARPKPQPTSPLRLQRIRPADLRQPPREPAGDAREQPPRAPTGEVRLSLRLAEGDEDAAHASPRVTPGQSVELVARVHNRTDRVDHFTVAVSGLPDDWWTVEPATVFLNPYGAPGRHEDEVRLRLHPPRAPGAEARPWPLTVSVVSESRRAEVASVAVMLEIAAYDELRAELRPARRSGHRRGRFTVAVTNASNARAEVALAARDEEDACAMLLDRPQLTIAPGETAATRLTVRPPGQHWIGRPVDHRFELTCGRPQEAAEAPRLPGVFRRRPWLPWWLGIVVGLLVVAAIALVALWPHTTRVPQLSGVRSPFAAQKLLTVAGLKLAPSPKPRLVADVAPGTIVDQDPQPGAKVPKGSVVTVVQAARRDERTVPSVVGLTPADADRQLRALGLSLGSVQPQPADVDAPIVAQLPPPGVKVKTGTAVNATLALDTAPGAPVAPPAASATASPSPTATPAPGPPSGLLAYDDGSKLMAWDAQGARPLLGPGEQGTEPAWAPDGKTLAYMRIAGDRGEIVQATPGAGAGQVVTDGEGDYHRPAVSPAGGLLAYIAKRDSRGGRLCLQPADGAVHPPSCLRAPGWTFGRQPAWSRDGRVIVVIGRHGRQEGLFGFRARGGTPSPEAGAWEPVGLLVELRGANALAWSPDGRTIAAIAGAQDQLWLIDASPDGTLGTPRALPARGCELTWTPDGRIAVSQYARGRQSTPAGPIVVLDPASPETTQPLPRVLGADPAWQPAAGG